MEYNGLETKLDVKIVRRYHADDPDMVMNIAIYEIWINGDLVKSYPFTVIGRDVLIEGFVDGLRYAFGVHAVSVRNERVADWSSRSVD